MYPSVEALSETRYLNHASLSHALSLRVRASVCAAAAERRTERVQMINFTLLNLSVNPRITCVPNRGDWSVRITDHL